MKKYICGLLLILPLLFGCSDPLQKPLRPVDSGKISAGMGRVIIGQEDSRTILPDAPEFVSYVISFQYQGDSETSMNEHTVSSLPCTVELAAGNWLVSVVANTYIEGVPGLDDGDYPAASGSSTVTVNASSTTQVSVNLDVGATVIGKGILEYNIGALPDEGPGSGAVLRILDMYKNEVIARDLSESASGTIIIDAGYYILQIQVSPRSSRSRTELLHIYSGHTTVIAEDRWIFNAGEAVYNSVEELSEFLSAAPANTIDTPYPVKLNVNLQDLAYSAYSYYHVLGALFNALAEKYVSVDLSDSTGTLETASIPDNRHSSPSTNKDKLVSIIFPETVTFIPQYTFNDCTSLKFVKFPESLERIGVNAFQNTRITNADLSGCSALATIVAYAFNACTSLEEIILPPSLRVIDDYAFAGSKISDVDLPASVETIGLRAFNNCASLVLNIPADSALQTIKAGALAGCSNYRTEMDFSGLEQLSSIDLSANTELENLDLSNCEKLVTVIMGNQKMLKNLNLSGCTSLPSIDPTSCTALKNLDLSGCTSLLSIILYECAAMETANLSNCSSLNQMRTYTAPSTPDGYIFKRLTNLKHIDLSNCTALTSLNYPAYYAFENCSALTTVNLSGCTSFLGGIGRGDFDGCTSLISVDLSGCTTIKTIYAGDFTNCTALQSINFSGCTALSEIRNNSFNASAGFTSLDLSDINMPPVLGNTVFNASADFTIYVSADVVDAYQTADGWSDYAGKIQAKP
ncbi:MAG: leucine-rich repeat protein [Treponema sp.]|jgi:hypothetical protein|nr:leucine-rich repeat protein [Treponema sp.]